jgi:hypothetical protein
VPSLLSAPHPPIICSPLFIFLLLLHFVSSSFVTWFAL